jgi:hypothetical protein
MRRNSRTRRQGISEILYSPQKLRTPLHMPPAPFYRETKGHLHFEIALGSREYSKWKHVHICLLHPSIRGAHFGYLLNLPSVPLRSWTFGSTPSTRLVHGFCLYSRRSSSVLIPAMSIQNHLWSQVSRAVRISEVFSTLKRRTNLRTRVLSANISPEGIRLENFRHSHFT